MKKIEFFFPYIVFCTFVIFLVNISIVEQLQKLYDGGLVIQGTRMYFRFFTIFLRRFSALAQEDPENHHILEVRFERL